jgi:hypothetical protein
MKWIKRTVVGSCVAAASLLAMPAVAGAQCIVSQSMTEPGGCASPPIVVGTSVTPPPVNTVAAAVVAPPADTLTTAAPATGSKPDVAAASVAPATTSSLPFTGADVEELAGLGIAAVLVGGLMVRRRRRPAA